MSREHLSPEIKTFFRYLETSSSCQLLISPFCLSASTNRKASFVVWRSEVGAQHGEQVWRRYGHLAAVCNRNFVTDLNSVGAEAAKAQSQVPQMAPLGLGSQLAGKSFPGLGAFRSDRPVCRLGSRGSAAGSVSFLCWVFLNGTRFDLAGYVDNTGCTGVPQFGRDAERAVASVWGPWRAPSSR